MLGREREEARPQFVSNDRWISDGAGASVFPPLKGLQRFGMADDDKSREGFIMADERHR